ncbi:hypothetical protein ONZ43_g2891 [Nemania bipapillata]|uniref:Uncharacterized protein n=1 Tax=Nemania bipapillata TaxID=110536 RepID=A0ACC2IYY5_9PEZI|nr:hypothetical protein ONZ43_g2891 [Nemania bipapillata]
MKCPTEFFDCFEDWKPQEKNEFIRYQWSVLAPVFEEGDYNDVPHYIIHDQNQLPFTHFEGSSELAYRCPRDTSIVHIHPGHHRFSDKTLSKRGFEIKSFHKDDLEAFKQEIRIASKFKGDNKHENMATLLATFELTYERQYKFHMIYYRADGDLYDYWEKAHPFPDFSYDNMLWASGQFQGLAHGLLATQAPYLALGHISAERSNPACPQNLFGQHDGMEPSNILYYLKPGSANPNLVIYNFGVSEMTPHEAGSPRFTITYRAPEYDIENKLPGQPADIWTLGCVYLEFVAWLLDGRSLVDRFTRQRRSPDKTFKIDCDTFFNSDEAGNLKVKDAVVMMIAEFHSHPRCTQYLHEFLELIEHGMLVINPEGRVKCWRLHERLDAMWKKCQSNKDYAMKPLPKPDVSVDVP